MPSLPAIAAAILAQAAPVVVQRATWLDVLAVILAGLSPVLLAIVAAYQQIKLARIARETSEIKKETKAQTAKIDQQTERIEEAATTRKNIAIKQAEHIETAIAKSVPQQVEVVNQAPIPVETQEGRE